MLNAHSKTGIAQIVFYVPVIAVATFLVAFRHGRPRMAWVLLLLFSLRKRVPPSSIRAADIMLQSAWQEALLSSSWSIIQIASVSQLQRLRF